MLGGVHRVPEDVLVGVGAQRVAVPARQTAQERWSLVAVCHGVCETQLQQQSCCEQRYSPQVTMMAFEDMQQNSKRA